MTGRAPNPNTRAAFRQVSLRSFQYSLKMIPETPEEATNIMEIVDFFRKNLYPIPVIEEDDYVLSFEFPNMFHFIFQTTGKDAKVIEPKLLPCYLTNMTTTYNSSSPAFMAQNGESVNFSEVDISLTFLEYRAVFQSDIEDNTFANKGLSGFGDAS